VLALPVRAGRRFRAARGVDEPARLQGVAVTHHPEFGPALHERNFPEASGKPFVADEAGDARPLEDVAQVGDLEDRLRRVDLAQGNSPVPGDAGPLIVPLVAPSR
jgi:hypothetical protein